MESTHALPHAYAVDGRSACGRFALAAGIFLLAMSGLAQDKPAGTYVAERTANGVAIRLTLELNLPMGDADLVTGSMDFNDGTDPVPLAGIFTRATGIATLQASQQRLEGGPETHQLTARYDAARDLFEVTLEGDEMRWIASAARSTTVDSRVPAAVADRVPEVSPASAAKDAVASRIGSPVAGVIGGLLTKPAAALRQLLMESARVEPAEGDPGQEFTLRFSYVISEVRSAAVLVAESATLETAEGSASTEKMVVREIRAGEGGVEMLAGGGGRVSVTYVVAPKRPGTYVWRIGIAAQDFASPPVTTATFVVREKPDSSEPIPTAHGDLPPAGPSPAQVAPAPEALPSSPAVPQKRSARDEAAEHLQKGMRLIATAKAAEAETEFDTAVRLDTTFGDAWFGLGLSRSQAEQWDRAAVAFRQAVRLLPEDADAHAYYAWSLLKLGRRDEAMREATEAKRLGASGHPVLKDLGLEP